MSSVQSLTAHPMEVGGAGTQTMLRPTRTRELFLIVSGFGAGVALHVLAIAYLCSFLQSGLSNFVIALVSR